MQPTSPHAHQIQLYQLDQPGPPVACIRSPIFRSGVERGIVIATEGCPELAGFSPYLQVLYSREYVSTHRGKALLVVELFTQAHQGPPDGAIRLTPAQAE